MDSKTAEMLRSQLRKVAPGTRLREALDAIIAGRTGALIVIGGEPAVAELCNGGFAIDTPFTPQRLFELAKMDGALMLDSECERILRANVHLVPDPSLPTAETGMRHRTAERVSRQTDALVISISQRREVVNLYLSGMRITLDDLEVILAKANQAIRTLERYRSRLDEELRRLTSLEFDDLVTVADVTEAIGSFELVRRVAAEVNHYISQLGTEGRLVRMQADELTANVDEDYTRVLRDYVADYEIRKIATARAKLAELPTDRLVEPDAIAPILGVSAAMLGPEDHMRPRGFRLLARIPALPSSVVTRIVGRFGSLQAILAASQSDLDDVDGVGARRARAITEGLARVRSHATI